MLSPGRRWMAAGLVVALLAGGAFIAFVALGSDSHAVSTPSSTIAASGPSPGQGSQDVAGNDANRDPKANGGSRHHRSPAYYRRHHLFRTVEPAHRVAHPEPSVVSAVMHDVVNAWRASTHRETIVVMAGSARGSSTTGRFAILRETLAPFDQKGDTVNVPGAGALRITKAPVGRKVVFHAVKAGNLHFTSENGIKGTLHLADDTVSLNR